MKKVALFVLFFFAIAAINFATDNRVVHENSPPAYEQALLNADFSSNTIVAQAELSIPLYETWLGGRDAVIAVSEEAMTSGNHIKAATKSTTQKAMTGEYTKCPGVTIIKPNFAATSANALSAQTSGPSTMKLPMHNLVMSSSFG